MDADDLTSLACLLQKSSRSSSWQQEQQQQKQPDPTRPLHPLHPHLLPPSPPPTRRPSPQTNLLERRLFYIPSFKIYGAVAGFYDYGPPGCAIKQNLTQVRRAGRRSIVAAVMGGDP